MLDHDQIVSRFTPLWARSSRNQARRQAELSKNLSAAYLNHQIAELENQVRGLPTPATNGQQPKAAAKEKPLARIDDHVSFGGGRIDHEEKERDEDIEVYDELDQEWRVAVVDVSAFMWAPKATKSLIQKGFEVIVPSSG
jgi:crotonobetainyl-CoA:carnitine CoA-transferase CaiB-like acyl-CoA transferase